MPRLTLLASAQRDLVEILDYVSKAAGSRTVGKQFVDRLTGKCRRLASLPGTLGRARPELAPGLRSFAYRDYVIFFRYQQGVFQVVNVPHGQPDFLAFFGDDEE